MRSALAAFSLAPTSKWASNQERAGRKSLGMENNSNETGSRSKLSDMLTRIVTSRLAMTCFAQMLSALRWNLCDNELELHKLRHAKQVDSKSVD